MSHLRSGTIATLGKAAEFRAAIVTYGLEINRAAGRRVFWQTLPAPQPAGAELGSRPSGRGFDSPQNWSCRGRSTMNRSRLEPLGVPEAGYELEEVASRNGPSSLDRWLLKQIITRLGPGSAVRATLWDEPDVAPRDGTVGVRFLDRKALW